jgi:hypothetical protein
MINITNIVKDFNATDLRAFLQAYDLGELKFKTFFPSQYTTKLTFETLEARFGAKVAADVVAFDSRAPRKGRPTFGKVTGDIPKIEIARAKKETDITVYQQLLDAITRTSANNVQNKQALNALVEWMYEDSVFVLDGVNARIEWLAKAAASSGKYTLSTTNNETGVVTPVPISFGIPDGNFIDTANDYADPTTAKPITDIKAVQKRARTKGYKIMYATTDQATMDKILASAEVQKFCASYIAVALELQYTPTLETLNSALLRNNLPQFRVWDSFVTIESKKGTQTAESGWTEGNINFSATSLLGQIQWTDTADGLINVGDAVKVYNDFTLVKTFAEEDPITVITKGIAYATPVLSGANQMFILKTKLS